VAPSGAIYYCAGMYEVEIEVSGQPQGKGRPRFTKSGHTYTPAKTRQYEARIKAAAWAEMKKHDLEPTIRPVAVEPKSWSKIKRLEAEYGAIRPLAKPDIDNILKAALDGIQGTIIVDDKQVQSIKAKKTYCHPDRGPVLYISVSWTDEYK
jgi:Holliday junction resolvase RusA-like endonuclease